MREYANLVLRSAQPGPTRQPIRASSRRKEHVPAGLDGMGDKSWQPPMWLREAMCAAPLCSTPRKAAPDEKDDKGPVMQSAFVFAKPHANTPAVVELVKSKFSEVGISILSEGVISGESIDAKQYIDQHYYAIASKATILKPNQLNVPKDKFKDKFGEEWSTVLAESRVFNALDACKHLEISEAALNDAWVAAQKAGKLVKFGGGFYCGLLELPGKPVIYTLNAFFMSMRGKFTAPGTAIHYFVVEFDARKLSWASFRADVLGPTNPADAPPASLRGLIHAKWKKLGLKTAPNTGDNGVHASASPFEGLAERSNWLEAPLEKDAFGQALLKAGIGAETLKGWMVDPQVVLPGEGGEKKGSLFDQLEDLDYEPCIAKAVEIGKAQPSQLACAVM